MKKKTLFFLGFVVVGLGVLIWYTKLNHHAGQSKTTSYKTFFEGKQDKVLAATRIVVRSKAAEVTLDKDKDGWKVSSHLGYPADLKKVNKTMIAMANIEVIEPKTEKAENYAALNLQSLDQESSKAQEITILDSEQQPVAKLLVGKLARFAQHYVREPEAAQTWLVKADFDLPKKAMGWLLKSIVKIDDSRIQGVDVMPAGANEKENTPFSVKRVEKGGGYLLQPVPDDYMPEAPYVLETLPKVITDLELKNVILKGDLAGSEPVSQLKFTTFDGLVLTADVHSKSDKTYVVFTASKGVGVEVKDASEAKPDNDTEQQAPVDAKIDIAAEVKKLNEKLSGWAYQLPDFAEKQFTKKHMNLLKKVEAEKQAIDE